MKPRLTALFLALIVLPLALALWLGLRSLENGQAAALTQARAVWTGPLNDLRSQVRAFVQKTEEGVRSGDDLVRTRFVLRGGEPVEPPRYWGDTANPFYSRTATLWERRFWEEGGEREAAASAGWVTWNADAPFFVYWYRVGDEVRGAELDAWSFLGRLSATLPELGWSHEEGAQRLLVVRNGTVFHQWGRWEPGDADPVLTLPLAAPFEGWTLQLYLSPQALGDSQGQWLWVFVLAGLGLAGVVGVGGWVFVRTLRASLEEASQRVRFVNQVSHELKTPLTNILLYGELLEGSLSSPPKAREYLEVIRGESSRLGRLITNVLSFARGKTDAPRLRDAEWNEVVANALKPFRPGLADRGLSLEWKPGDAVTGRWDHDWVGQIIGNLVSNAEKYGATGGVVLASTGADEHHVWAVVADRGPGIPPAAAERVFVPFARLDDRLTAAAGTGLGLGISRDLARRHGGDLVLEPGPGAVFRLTLPREDV